jgi:hypothetical protein
MKADLKLVDERWDFTRVIMAHGVRFTPILIARANICVGRMLLITMQKWRGRRDMQSMVYTRQLGGHVSG